MSYFKKNKLISFIVIAMLFGLLLGYGINKSLTTNKFHYSGVEVEKIKNPVVKAKVQQSMKQYEEQAFRESKKEVAANYSILSDIFLHLIKMIIAPLVLAVLVIGVAKVGDFKSVGRIGLKTLVYFLFLAALAGALGVLHLALQVAQHA